MLGASGRRAHEDAGEVGVGQVEAAAGHGYVFPCYVHRARLRTETVELPAHFMLWLASNSQEKKYLHGRMVWANWDVGELAGKAEEIEQKFWLTMGTLGWPFGQGEKLEMLRGSIK